MRSREPTTWKGCTMLNAAIREQIEHLRNEAAAYEAEAATHLARADECNKLAHSLNNLLVLSDEMDKEREAVAETKYLLCHFTGAHEAINSHKKDVIISHGEVWAIAEGWAESDKALALVKDGSDAVVVDKNTIDDYFTPCDKEGDPCK